MRLLPLALALALLAAAAPGAAAGQNDAGSGGDAGDAFETATPLAPAGAYAGALDRAGGDRHDWYRFFLEAGKSVMIAVDFEQGPVDPVRLVDPRGVVLDQSSVLARQNVVEHPLGATRLYNPGPLELTVSVARAPVTGWYRLHLAADAFDGRAYSFCFVSCEGPQDAPIGTIFGGSLKHPDVRILLVPPAHGDLGNPAGPSVLDYLAATVRGIHRWESAVDAFAADHPQYAYLDALTMHVEIFDGARPVEPAGYDILVVYVETSGPAFRGLATDALPVDAQRRVVELGLGDALHVSGRTVLLSLLASSPRAGQVHPDYPEANDLEWVTMHEFAHAFGLGHTLTWHPEHGPDLMNSPAAFVYGDGDPLGDGGERTPRPCASSLDLYGLAVLYRWLPSGVWEGTSGFLASPLPYALYCGPQA